VLTLLVFSLYFYYKAAGVFLVLLVLSTAFDFLLGRWLGGSESKRESRILLWTGVALNVAVLLYFRYSRHWSGLVRSLQGGRAGLEALALPVGVSYYTFQKISYLADIFRRKVAPAARLGDFLLYVCFFPRVAAGPIVRAGEFLPQLDQPFAPEAKGAGEGLFLILSGLLKKAVIADFIGINFVDRVFAAPGLYSGLENLLAVYGYAVQIYCDFSGYTDIALGTARLLGIRLPPNFASPYKALTVSDFWRRWHITLSNWLRDYLFLPAAYILCRRIKADKPLGLRADIWAAVAAALLTWLVCGFWHGAAWGFIIWGLLHGTAVSVENIFRLPKKAARTRRRRILARILTFHYICLAWIFFRADTLRTAGAVLGRIFGSFKLKLLFPFIGGYPVVFTLIVLGLLLHFAPGPLKDRVRRAYSGASPVVQSLVLAAALWIVFQFRAAGIQPFIYFKF
jgi:D-alanyl-lipoteichoic acid acyltransferase DltB (MBOAT superfamily)